jgi:lipopolysaccharide transport system ATP-binding protein
MSDIVIRVENLGKKYTLGHQKQERYTALRDVIANGAKSVGRKFLKPFGKKMSDPAIDEFWALKDVSFEIKQGDRVGIIGRNGAGKSTLLKILSRITEPTNGSVRIKGRVASLLEVGTGFHPELTGRENIYLNGAILGMSKVEIKKKFDEIVEFAEVEKFLDTPVKRYSSGMYVRLAFAVAAHLEPEILIVDEVLAVGDAQFQKKCLGKMEDVGKKGRTVLFVSHNMSAIQSLCERCILLQSGNIVVDKTSAAAVQFYLQNFSASDSFTRHRHINGRPTLISGRIKSVNHLPESPVQLDLEIFTSEKRCVSLDLRLADGTATPVGFGSLGTLKPSQLLELRPGLNSVSLIFSINQLAVGSYFISLDLTLPDAEFYDRVENCLSFDVVRPPSDGFVRVLSQSWGYGSFELPLKATINSHILDK